MGSCVCLDVLIASSVIVFHMFSVLPSHGPFSPHWNVASRFDGVCPILVGLQPL